MNIVPIATQAYSDQRLSALENMEDRQSTVYLDSANPQHPTIGIGFDLTVDDNLSNVLEAMNVVPTTGNGQTLFQDLQTILGGHWSNATLGALRDQMNAAYTLYLVREGSRPATGPDSVFSVTDAQIETAFNDIVEAREEQLHNFLEAYGIDLDGNASNNGNATDFYSRLPQSNERLALLSLLFNSRIHPAGHPNAGMPTTLTSPNRRGGALIDALRAGNRPEAWFEIRYNTNKNSLAATPPSDADGIAKRRYYESELFGLYSEGTTPDTISADEALSIYRMYTSHKDRILQYEHVYSDQVGNANSDYFLSGDSTVGMLAESLQVARGKLIEEYVVKGSEPFKSFEGGYLLKGSDPFNTEKPGVN